MVSTDLTRLLGVRHPIVQAPMAGWSGGVLAGAVARAGAFGMIGVSGSTPTDFVAEQAALAREHGPFGFGLMSWVLEDRPGASGCGARREAGRDLALLRGPGPVRGTSARGRRGDPEPGPERRQGRASPQAGVDVLVAQGTDAGGHTGSVGTMPLLQRVLPMGQAAGKPVLAAGGIATGEAVAGVLAMGAAGAWIGTRFCATAESLGTEAAKRQILEADETATVHTRVFDLVQGIPWPEEFPGRAIRNAFSERWHGREAELAAERGSVSADFEEARGDYSEDFVYAGQAAGLVEDLPSAGELVERLMAGAEDRLRACQALVQVSS